ncbi:MAG: hypothetical protein ACLTKG_01785 [Collinsella intestinalis]
MRELQGAIEPLGTPLLNIATNVAGVVKSFGEWFDGTGRAARWPRSPSPASSPPSARCCPSGNP